MLLGILLLQTQCFYPKDAGIDLLPVVASPPLLLQIVSDHLIYPNDKKNRIRWLWSWWTKLLPIWAGIRHWEQLSHVWINIVSSQSIATNKQVHKPMHKRPELMVCLFCIGNKTGVPNQFQAHWDPQLQLTVACFSSYLDSNMKGLPYGSWLIDHQGMSPFFLGPSPEEQGMTAGFTLHAEMIERSQPREVIVQYIL